MIAGEGHVIYVSGDTDVTSDMGLWAELHNPDIGILNCGGHYTMDMKRAAFACRKFFNFKTVIRHTIAHSDCWRKMRMNCAQVCLV